MITPQQSKKIIDTLKENVSCYEEGIDINECIRCEICRYNVHCVNDPINYSINEYIITTASNRDALQKELEEFNKAKLIFDPEFNGISFGDQSPSFLEGLLLARKRTELDNSSWARSLVTFNNPVISNRYKSKKDTAVTAAPGRLITSVVERLTSVVFQETFVEIGCFNQNPSFQISPLRNKEIEKSGEFSPKELLFFPEDISDDFLVNQIERDIDISSTQLYSPYFGETGSISSRVLLSLHPRETINRLFDSSSSIYPRNKIATDILFNKNISESVKKMFFEDAFLDRFKKISFTKKNYKDEFTAFIFNDLENRNAFIGCLLDNHRRNDNDYNKRIEFVNNYVQDWKNNNPFGKKYQQALQDYFISSSVGNYKNSYSVAGKKGSNWRRKSITTMPLKSPYMNSIGGEFLLHEEKDNKNNLLNQFIPSFDLENIRTVIHNRPESTGPVVDYGSINEWKTNSSLNVTLGGPGEDDMIPNPENSIDYLFFDNIELKATPGKKVYYKNKKVNYFPPTAGPIFHISSEFGFDLLEHGKLGDKIHDLKKELLYSRRENLFNALKFLADVKLDKILDIIDPQKLQESGIIDINPSLGKDIISVKKFNNLLNADSYNIPYSSLSILAVYSRMVRDVLQDVNFSAYEKNQKLIDFIYNLKDDEELQKTSAANKKITAKNLFLPRISPSVIKKVAKKYKIRQKDVLHQAQVILNFILMKLINRFEKTAHSLIYHDYLKQVQELKIDLLPEYLSAGDKLDVEIINPIVWKPYHEGIKRSDSNSASLDEIKTFLGRRFHSHLSRDVAFGKSFLDDNSEFPSQTSLIIKDINKSLKAVGAGLTFSIRPIFSQEVEYINNKEENSRAKFSGNFRMFVSSKTVESPLDKAGEGVSALISIFARIHSSLLSNRILLSSNESTQTVSIVREPENHLHPNFIAKLIKHIFEISNSKEKEPWQLLNKIAKKGLATKRIFILETHSEVVLRQVQASIKKHSSKNKNLESLVKVYYVDQKSVKENNSDKKQIKSIVKDLKLKNNGFFDRNIPKGFFDVNTNLIADLWKEDYKPKKKVKK